MKNSIIFDLDGTLWDTTESTYISVNMIASKYNLKEISRDTICKVFGLNREQSAKLYFPDMNLNESVKLIDEIAVININNLKNKVGTIYPKAKETLSKLAQNYDLYIVSNTAEEDYIKAFLDTADVNEYFKDYIAASSLKISKADAIKKVINDNKIENAVYVGDTAMDMESANLNGIKFVQARYGFGQDLKTEYYINSLEELIKLF